jgi:zinc protease
VKELSIRGASVIVEPSRAIPLVSLTVTARGGSAGDPVGLEGRAHHIAELAVRGAGDRDRAAIDSAFDELGTSLSVHSARDSFGYSVTCLRRNLEPMCRLLGDVLARPRFTAGEHRRLIRETTADIEDLRDDDAELAARSFARFFAPGHPYSRALDGTARSLRALARIDPAELAASYRDQVRASNLVLGFSGELDEETAARTAEALLAPLEGPAPPPPVVPEPPPAAARRCYLIDKPERSQSQILIGHRGPAYGTGDSVAMMLVEAAFGGMFSSRLMQEIRVKRGWSYGAGMRLARSRSAHWLRMSLAPSVESAADAIALVVRMYEELAAGGLDADEIDLARRFVVGSIGLNRATARQRVRIETGARAFGLPLDFHRRLGERLAALDCAAIAATLERVAAPASLMTVVVGTAGDIAGALEKLPVGELQVVPYREY